MRACLRCPIYRNYPRSFKSRLVPRTCGTPGMLWENPKRGTEQMGCLCFMPLAAKSALKNCWAWEVGGTGLDIGWKDELNGAWTQSK